MVDAEEADRNAAAIALLRSMERAACETPNADSAQIDALTIWLKDHGNSYAELAASVLTKGGAKIARLAARGVIPCSFLDMPAMFVKGKDYSRWRRSLLDSALACWRLVDPKESRAALGNVDAPQNELNGKALNFVKELRSCAEPVGMTIKELVYATRKQIVNEDDKKVLRKMRGHKLPDGGVICWRQGKPGHYYIEFEPQS